MGETQLSNPSPRYIYATNAHIRVQDSLERATAPCATMFNIFGFCLEWGRGALSGVRSTAKPPKYHRAIQTIIRVNANQFTIADFTHISYNTQWLYALYLTFALKPHWQRLCRRFPTSFRCGPRSRRLHSCNSPVRCSPPFRAEAGWCWPFAN